MKKKNPRKSALSLFLAALLLFLTACGGKDTTAAAMHLRRAEGTVSVSDGDGKDIPVLDNLGLYSGYGVGTRAASRAWIDLDEVKLAKLDQNSEIAIRKEGKALDIELRSGSLFFNVTEPLADDETMNIRTSTMLVGIRGTCGWVEDNDGLSRVYLLTGRVECSAGGQTVQVSAGEMAELTAGGELTVKEFPEQDTPAFVREEVDSGPDEPPGPGGSEAPEISGGPEGELLASGEAGENVTWSFYSDGTLTVSGAGPMDDYSFDDTLLPWYEYRTEIKTVIIDDGVTSIGDRAFNGCTVQTVDIGRGVTRIGDYAFCFTGLNSVTIPGNVTRIGDCAFNNCRSLTGVTISPGVTSIGAGAFYECTSLYSVTIPDGVTSIGEEAFYNCRGLYYATIPDSVTSIGKGAFWQCYKLQEAAIPNGVTSIEYEVFYYCSSLASITIPASVTSIDQYAFYNCNWLADVYYGGSESQWEQISINESGNGPLLSATVHHNSAG